VSNSPHDTALLESFAGCWLDAEPTIRAYVRAAVRNPADADDVVQDAAHRMARSFGRYDPDRPFVPWALSVTRSAVIDHIREKNRGARAAGEEVFDALADAHARAHGDVVRMRRTIAECLRRLPARWVGIVQLRYRQDFPPALIAEQLSMTPEAVRAVLMRIRRRLADCLAVRMTTEPDA